MRNSRRKFRHLHGVSAVVGDLLPASSQVPLSDANSTPLRVGEPLGTPARNDPSKITGPWDSAHRYRKGSSPINTKSKELCPLSMPATSLLVICNGTSQRRERSGSL
jgi:hypothetical protein